jgi:hypothetical protein
VDYLFIGNHQQQHLVLQELQDQLDLVVLVDLQEKVDQVVLVVLVELQDRLDLLEEEVENSQLI